MAKRVFFSFHYQDVSDFRANVVRQHWVAKADREEAGYFDASIWEEARKTSDIALKRLINSGLDRTTATAVLIGSQTYERPWVRYEIIKSFERGNKLFGVHINSVKCKEGKTKVNGPDPFDFLALSFSADGQSAEAQEWVGGKWVQFSSYQKLTLAAPAPASVRGKALKLSQLGINVYCWNANDGYNNFSSWV